MSKPSPFLAPDLPIALADPCSAGPFLPSSRRWLRSHPPGSTSPPPSSAPSSSRALAVRPAGEVSHPVVHRGPERLATLLREPSRGIASLPWASRLIMDGDWLRSALRSSFGEGLAPGRASVGACPAITRAPGPSPLPRGGVLIHGPRTYLGRMTTQKTCSSAPGGAAFFAKGFSGGRLTR